jgi:hypothetical protein
MVLAVRWSDYPPPFGLLAAAERRHALRLPPWRGRQWVTGRLTARAALLLYLGSLPADLEILPGPDGAPALTGTGTAADVLSIAHCDEWAACGCGPAGHGLGVDVEEAGACDDALLARVSVPGEPGPGPATATHGWARKEAAFKACRGMPPVLTRYRLAGSAQVVVSGGPVSGDPVSGGPVSGGPVSGGTAHAGRVLATRTASLPGAVLAAAGTDPRPPVLRVLDAEAVVAMMVPGQPGRRPELARGMTRGRTRWDDDA